ncbi:unnamed protein product [Blepharisma stoltei]|uniref:RING-type domain-containing protein n=1 Tax=Blepharisma stoltei TaxID=1481888 RepID=A0AAU9IE85_9CILI|nr:unnamed protein product [Blepharisma stoltei]
MQADSSFYKLDIILPTGQLSVQSFQGATPTQNISTLIFQRLIQIFDFPYLPFLLTQDLSHHVCALLYFSQDEEGSQSSFFILEQLLTQGLPSSSPILMVELGDPANPDFVYLLAHIQDRPGLGSFFYASKLAIFKFTYTELFGEGMDSIVNYIKAAKIARDEIFSQTLALKEAIEQKNKENAQYAQLSGCLFGKLKLMKEQHESSSEQIRHLNSQLKSQRKAGQDELDQDLECLLCRNSVKNIVFLPCGHIVACKECVIDQMKIQLNTPTGRRAQGVLCPLCKTKIREAREVYF